MDSLISSQEATARLKNSEVVALPTETVYGLAGRVDDDQALKKIFATKSRPFFDPLIIHVENLEKAQLWAQWDPVSTKLAENFWPGPLTLVLAKKPSVSDLITNGGPTVALRCPDHPVFQEILAGLGTAVAAPSANMFGQTSPTKALHVVEEFSGEVPVVDGGACHGGIESTIVEVDSKNQTLKILRPGILHAEDFSSFFKAHDIPYSVQTFQQQHVPGHLKNHYQPQVPFVLIDGLFAVGDIRKDLNSINNGEWKELELPEDPALAARQLYAKFREFSALKQAFFFKISPQQKQAPQWQGLLDRMQKASTHTLLKTDTELRVIPKK